MAAAAAMTDAVMEAAGEGESAAQCKLCEFTGCENPKFQDIMNYVHDHAHEVHIDGLSAQVQKQLLGEFSLDLTLQQIKTHFLYHKCDQKTVLNHVLRELVPLISVTKQSCSVTQDGTTIVDPKALNVYLDSVKQVMSVYKHLDTMRGPAARR
jgi:hypothetical protein